MAETLTTIMLGIMMMMMIMILVATLGAQLDSLTKNSLNQTRYPMYRYQCCSAGGARLIFSELYILAPRLSAEKSGDRAENFFYFESSTLLLFLDSKFLFLNYFPISVFDRLRVFFSPAPTPAPSPAPIKSRFSII